MARVAVVGVGAIGLGESTTDQAAATGEAA